MVPGTLPAGWLVPTIVGLAVVQIVVHLVCFLHMSAASEQRWNVVALGFAILVVGILIDGVALDHAEHQRQHDDPGGAGAGAEQRSAGADEGDVRPGALPLDPVGAAGPKPRFVKMGSTRPPDS